MRENGLFSSYTIPKYRVQKTPCDESIVSNELKSEISSKALFSWNK